MNPLVVFQQTLRPRESAVFFSAVSRRYLTGFQSSDGVLFVTSSEAVLYLDSRYYEMACIKMQRGELASGLVIKPYVFQNEFSARSEKGEAPVAYFEDKTMTVAQFSSLQKRYPKTEFVPLGNRVEEMRIVKSPAEIEKIATAQKLAEAAFLYILPRLEKGRTEYEVAAELEYYMKKNGASAPSFPTICVSGTRSSLPHGRPENVLLTENSFLTLDFGCVLDGYASDMTRTVCLGKASEKMRLVYQTVLKAQLSALSAIRGGVSGKEVDAAARNVIAEAGFGEYFGHSTGHGIGLKVHEAPSFSPSSEGTVPAGAVLSVEPGIYLPGEFGVRIEDLVVVEADGIRNLNGVSKELMEL